MKLVIDHIRKNYGARPVLKDCSGVFEGCGVHVLMGPNGCGKSTLLRICSLIEDPDGGDLRYYDDGSPLVHDIGLRRRMTLVLARTGAFNTTVFRNVAYGLQVRGASRPAIEERVSRALAFVGIGHLARRNALTLSSGEMQRMGLARALAVEPEILFLDEPTASVDEENTGVIESIILAMRTAGRTLVIMTTHDRDQAERLADRLLVLDHGILRETPR